MQRFQGGNDQGALSAQQGPAWSGLHQRALGAHPMFGALGGYGQRRPGLSDAMNQFRGSQGIGPMDGGARGLMGAAGAMDNPAFRQFMGMMMQRPQTKPGGGLQLGQQRSMIQSRLQGRPAAMSGAAGLGGIAGGVASLFGGGMKPTLAPRPPGFSNIGAGGGGGWHGMGQAASSLFGGGMKPRARAMMTGYGG